MRYDRVAILLVFPSIIALFVPFSTNGQELGRETVPEGERLAIDELGKLQILAGTHDPRLKGRRVQHTKGHACVQAEFAVNSDVPAEYKLGVFAEPKKYRAVVRFSNGQQFTDAAKDVHGMAVKLYGVGGEKLLGELDQTDEQDFILMDSPIFFAKTVQATLNLAKFRMEMAAGKQPPVTNELKAVLAIGEKVRKQPISVVQSYFSAVPYRLGSIGVKYEAIPKVPGPVGTATTENALRESLAEALKTGPIEFEFAIRPQTNAESEPIEDPTVEWKTKPIVLATVTIPAQSDFLTDEAQEKCETLSFNPWHSLTTHQPLGGISRARREIYLNSAALRAKQRLEAK